MNLSKFVAHNAEWCLQYLHCKHALDGVKRGHVHE